MAASTDFQFICSENYNAPGLGNAWGALINVLDSCLVDGVVLPAITDITSSGTQLTITFATNHKLKMFQVLRLSGFIPAILNDDFRIIGIPSVTAVVVDSAITSVTTVGSATLKPLGYEKTFTGVNKAVYRDKNTSAAYRPFLRVDNSLDPVYSDAYAKYAKVGVLENCSGIDDISSTQIPFDASNPTKNWVGIGSGISAYSGWAKWYYARREDAYTRGADSSSPDNGNRPWMIVGNGQAFYLINPMTPSGNHKLLYGFGVYDLISGVDATPYYLLATWDYSTVGESRDFSRTNNTAPLLNDSNPVILFNGVGVSRQILALPDHSSYVNSGTTNTYANDFVCMPFMLKESSYLMGVLPSLRHINKSRSDNAFATFAYSDYMYVIDTQMRDRRYAFNLGAL